MKFWQFWLSEFATMHIVSTLSFLIGPLVSLSTGTAFNGPVAVIIFVSMQFVFFGGAWFLFRREEKRLRS